jgi:hypothetical protein
MTGTTEIEEPTRRQTKSLMSVLDANYFLSSESCCFGVSLRTNNYNGRTRLDRITCAFFL